MPRLILNLANPKLKSADQQAWDDYVRSYKNSSSNLNRIEPKIKHQRAKQSTVLDLHGLTLMQAFLAVKDFCYQHAIIGTKIVKIITGKRGLMQKELPIWCESIAVVKAVKPIFDTQKICGSYEVHLKHR